MIETVLSQLSLKDTPFKILEPISEEEIQLYNDALKTIEPNIDALVAKKDISKCSGFEKFLSSHYIRRTYYFHVKQCLEISCPFHSPMRCKEEIERFPEPIPYTDEDEVECFKEGKE